MQIRWNGLHFEAPDKWDVIVKDPRHLIIERELKPVLELRWQPPGTGKSSATIDRIVSQLTAGSDCRPSPELINLLPDGLTSRFGVQAFSLDRGLDGCALLLTCTSCTTTLLVRIYKDSLTRFAELPTIFESLDCHPGDSEKARWQIQDFYFTLPGEFNLEASSFRFGITKLIFKGGSSELELCRLAPASHHLQHNPLSALFHSFSSAPPEQQVAADPSTLSYSYTPGIVEHLWSRVRRNKVYQSAWFVHFPLGDRILGYNIRSSKPIDSRVESMIEDSYGIIQKEEEPAGTTHP